MLKTRIQIVLVLFVLAATSCISAQATDESRKAASELVRLCMPKSQYDSMIQTISSQMGTRILADMKERGIDAPADFAERLTRTMLEVMPYDEQLALATDAYVNNFSLEEIQQIAAFYKTPIGQKVLSVQPKIAGETMQKLAAKLGDRLPAAMEHNGLMPEAAGPKPQPASAPKHHAASPKTAPTK